MCAASITYSTTIDNFSRQSFTILPEEPSMSDCIAAATTQLNLPAIVVANNKARSVYHQKCIVPNEDYNLEYNAIGSTGASVKNQHRERLSYPSKEFFNKVSTKLKNLRPPVAAAAAATAASTTTSISSPAANEVRDTETKRERVAVAASTIGHHHHHHRAMEKPMFITTVKSGSFLEPPPEVAALLGLRKNSNHHNGTSSSGERGVAGGGHHGRATCMYSFASKPRLVKSTLQAHTPPRNLLTRSENRRKKRDTAAEASQPTNGNSDGSIHYGNTMYDRRVARGSNFASSRPNVVSTEHVLSRQAEARRRAAVRQRAQIRARKLRMGTPPPIDGRRHEQMQTEKYLEELVERPPEKSIGCQADLPVDADTPSFAGPDTTAAAGSVDAETQLHPGDLPDHDDDHQNTHTVVATIVNKILREAILEINEEIERFRSYSYEQSARASSWERTENGDAVIITKDELATLIQTAMRHLKTSEETVTSVRKLEQIQSTKLLEVTITEIRSVVRDVKFLAEIMRSHAQAWASDISLEAAANDQQRQDNDDYENDFEGDDIVHTSGSATESNENINTAEESTRGRLGLAETDETDGSLLQADDTDRELSATESEHTATRADETTTETEALKTDRIESGARDRAEDLLKTEDSQMSEVAKSHETRLDTVSPDHEHPGVSANTDNPTDENRMQAEVDAIRTSDNRSDDGIEVDEDDLRTESRLMQTEDEVRESETTTTAFDETSESQPPDNARADNKFAVSRDGNEDTTEVRTDNQTEPQVVDSAHEEQINELKNKSIVHTTAVEDARPKKVTNDTPPENEVAEIKENNQQTESDDNRSSPEQKKEDVEALTTAATDELQSAAEVDAAQQTESAAETNINRSTTLAEETQSAGIEVTQRDGHRIEDDDLEAEDNTEDTSRSTAEAPESTVAVEHENHVNKENRTGTVASEKEEVRLANAEAANQEESVVRMKRMTELESRPLTSRDELTTIEVEGTEDSEGGNRSKTTIDDDAGDEPKETDALTVQNEFQTTAQSDNADQANATDTINVLETEQSTTAQTAGSLAPGAANGEVQSDSQAVANREDMQREPEVEFAESTGETKNVTDTERQSESTSEIMQVVEDTGPQSELAGEVTEIAGDAKRSAESTSKETEVAEETGQQSELTGEVTEVAKDAGPQSESTGDVTEVAKEARPQSESTSEVTEVVKDAEHSAESTSEATEITGEVEPSSESTSEITEIVEHAERSSELTREVAADTRRLSASTSEITEVTGDAGHQSESTGELTKVSRDAGIRSESINEMTEVIEDTEHKLESTSEASEVIERTQRQTEFTNEVEGVTEDSKHQSESTSEVEEATKDTEHQSESPSKVNEAIAGAQRFSEDSDYTPEPHRTRSKTMVKRHNSSLSTTANASRTEERQENDADLEVPKQTEEDIHGEDHQAVSDAEIELQHKRQVEYEHPEVGSEHRTDNLHSVAEKPLSYGMPVQTKSNDQPTPGLEQFKPHDPNQREITEGPAIPEDETATAVREEGVAGTPGTVASNTPEEPEHDNSTTGDENRESGNVSGTAVTTNTSQNESTDRDATATERRMTSGATEDSGVILVDTEEVTNVTNVSSADSETTDISSANTHRTAFTAQNASNMDTISEVHTSTAEHAVSNSRQVTSSILDNDQTDSVDAGTSLETSTSVETVIPSREPNHSGSRETASSTVNRQTGSNKATQATNSRIDAASRLANSYSAAPTRQQSTSTELDEDESGIQIEETHIIEETYTETTKRYKEISIHETTVVETEIIEYSEQLTADDRATSHSDDDSEQDDDNEEDDAAETTSAGDDEADSDSRQRRRSSGSSNDVVIGGRHPRQIERLTNSEGQGRELSASNVSVKLDSKTSSAVLRNGNVVLGSL